jgi:GNAT superfamily N-acetyltransferase
MSLIGRAIEEMERNGIDQWDAVYPDKDVILSDIASGCLYSATNEGVLLGVVALNEDQSTEYQSVNWEDRGRPLIVHRLCVDTAFQHKRVGRQLMLFAEKYARDNDYSSIRLDTFAENRIALALYESLQYQRRGLVRFRKGDFYCLEKLMKQQ